jgi:hypothetical protein
MALRARGACIPQTIINEHGVHSARCRSTGTLRTSMDVRLPPIPDSTIARTLSEYRSLNSSRHMEWPGESSFGNMLRHRALQGGHKCKKKTTYENDGWRCDICANSQTSLRRNGPNSASLLRHTCAVRMRSIARVPVMHPALANARCRAHSVAATLQCSNL